MDRDTKDPARTSRVTERREEGRHPQALHIHYHREDSEEIREGMLLDLTMHGAGIRTRRPLPVGYRIILEVVSPDGTSAEIPAEVQHSRRRDAKTFRSGITFIDLDPTAKAAIEEIIRVDLPADRGHFPRDLTPPSQSLLRIATGLERRQASRVALDRSISYKIFGPEGRIDEEGVAQIIDLSLTGVGLRTAKPVPQGISIQLEVVCSGGIRCAIEAECIYGRKEEDGTFLNGLRFTAEEKSDLVYFSRVLST